MLVCVCPSDHTPACLGMRECLALPRQYRPSVINLSFSKQMGTMDGCWRCVHAIFAVSTVSPCDQGLLGSAPFIPRTWLEFMFETPLQPKVTPYRRPTCVLITAASSCHRPLRLFSPTWRPHLFRSVAISTQVSGSKADAQERDAASPPS